MRGHGAASPDGRKYVASMKRSTAISGIVASLFIGTFIGWAGSNGSVEVAEVPVFAVCALLAYLINWVAFVPSYRARTEAFYDLTGSATYLTLTALALVLSNLDGRAFLVAGLVSVWAIRLGTFLFRRVKQDGGDGRYRRCGSSSRWPAGWRLSPAPNANHSERQRRLARSSGSADSPSKPPPTGRSARSRPTQPTTDASSQPACGPGPDTRTTSVRSRCGLALPSSRYLCCRDGAWQH